MKPTDSVSAFEKLGIAAQRGGGTKPRDRLGQAEFLELMIAQLRNQDPLKPMENGEFLGQMAQFGTVSGIQDLQASIEQLAGALQSGQALQASALVGRAVLVPGGSGELGAGGAGLTGQVDLPDTATALTLTIQDAGGQTVRTLELGAQAAGPVSFKWDGLTDAGRPAAPGIYRVTAQAVIGSAPTAVEAALARRVESVSIAPGGQGVTLNLTGGRSVSLGEVRQIL